MKLTTDQVRRIADLARIEIDAADAAGVQAKLDTIFEMIDRLDDVDTGGVEPMSHALDLTAPMRADAVTETDRHVQYQKLAPAVEDGLYLVPRVVE